ncbi:MAG: hypothetical protein ABIO92_04470 [Chloroflexia bacterium]
MRDSQRREATASHTLTKSALVVLASAFFSVCLGSCSADCGWSGRAEAFVDGNANGILDTGEPPLAGAKIHLEDSFGQTGYGGRPETQSDGHVSLNFLVPCNKTIDFVVVAEAPDGYEIATPNRAELGSESGKTATFGFRARK